MEIFLTVLTVIIFLIIIILALPVHIIIKKEPEEEFFFEIKALFFKFSSDDNSSLSFDSLKKRFEKKDNSEKIPKEDKSKQKLTDKISKYASIISKVFSELARLFKKINVNRLHITVVCAEENAADTAISYGKCCAILYPLAGMINSVSKVNVADEKIDIFCDYTSEKFSFKFDTDISIRIFQILLSLIKIGLKTAKK